jgi:hypothetical protein
MQHLKIVATPADKPWMLAFSTNPDGSGAVTPPMVGGQWEGDLAPATYFFSLTVTANGQTGCEIVVTKDGAPDRDLKFKVPGDPATPRDFPENWIEGVS